MPDAEALTPPRPAFCLFVCEVEPLRRKVGVTHGVQLIGGLAGQGKLGIPNGIMGLYDADGKVELFGQELNFKDTKSVLQAGVAMVSEDRKGVGLLLDRSIEDTIVFNAMQIKGSI